jgi:hypothetical protein
MGVNRNGARSFLDVIAKACKLSHLPGFQTGILRILGPENGLQILGLWNDFCAAVEALIALDNYFNKVDTNEETPGSEDILTEPA